MKEMTRKPVPRITITVVPGGGGDLAFFSAVTLDQREALLDEKKEKYHRLMNEGGRKRKTIKSKMRWCQ